MRHVQRKPVPLGETVNQPAPADAPSPVVLYIAGSGRSGSTLLERTIGAVSGVCNVGELIDLPRKVLPDRERCGCGVSFETCPLWSAVGKTAFDDWDPAWAASLHRLQTQVARQRHLPSLLRVTTGSAFDSALQQYGEEYRKLYSAVAKESGATYIVDASKWPAQALALHRAGLDVRVIHLVRDVRGVTHSLSKRDVSRPQAACDDVMYRNPPALGAARWLTTQTEADLLRWCGLRVSRMRYRDFVERPRLTVRSTLEALEVPIPPGGLNHIDGRSVNLQPSHGLSGNPSRFRHGRTVLRSDDAWRDQMRARDRVTALAIGLPQVLRTSRPERHAIRPVLDQPVVLPAPGGGSCSGRSEIASVAPDTPVVSVVLPTHGRPELVREAVRSVVAQDYAGKVQCLVVHDREEPDEALQALGRADRSVTVVRNTHTPGLAGARNTGLDLAGGAFIATLDDDDRWHPEKLRRQVERFGDDPDILVLGSGIRLLLSDGRVAVWPGRADRIDHELLLRNRVKELHSSTLIMRRDAFAKAGTYDEELPGGYAEDYDFVLRVARVGTIGIIREPLADIRKIGQSYYEGRAERTAAALQAFLHKHPEISRTRRGHARILGQMAFAESSAGQKRAALDHAVRALSRWPLSPHPYVALALLVPGVDPQHMARLARRLGRGMA